MSAVPTVLGSVDSGDLGRTYMHEHVFVDSRVWLEPSHERNAPPPTAPVSIETLGFLRWNPHSLEDNLIVDDPDAIVMLEQFQRHGEGIVRRSVVDEQNLVIRSE